MNNELNSATQAAMPEVDALCNRIVELRAALHRIANTSFGWDGDCGVTTVAEDALYGDEQAEAAAPPSPQPVAEKLPTNDQVYAEVCRQRALVSGNSYVSTNAVNDVMAAVRALQPVARQDAAGGLSDEQIKAAIKEFNPGHLDVPHGALPSFVRAILRAAKPATTAPAIEPVAGLTDADVWRIRDTIKPGDGWDGDNWDLALAYAIERHITGQAGASGESN